MQSMWKKLNENVVHNGHFDIFIDSKHNQLLTYVTINIFGRLLLSYILYVHMVCLLMKYGRINLLMDCFISNFLREKPPRCASLTNFPMSFPPMFWHTNQHGNNHLVLDTLPQQRMTSKTLIHSLVSNLSAGKKVTQRLLYQYQHVVQQTLGMAALQAITCVIMNH